MRKSSALFVLLLIAMMGLGAGCNGSNASLATFLLTIANIGPVYHSSGVFNTPVGETAAAPAGPGQGYEFNFKAGPGSFLSFATMMVQTNDKFFAPLPSGIELFPGGDPVDADITSMVYLWDAGTEVDAEPGTGPDQPPRESGPNTGADQGGVVEMANDGFTYPDVDQVVQVTITPVDPLVVPTEFMVEINNVSVAGQLSTSMGDVDIPISPGVWVVHSSPAPLFDDGVADYGYGLEAIAEDGDPSGLGTYLAGNSGLVSPIAPGVWVSANIPNVVWTQGQADYGEGLEGLAEDGNASDLFDSLKDKAGVASLGVFDTAVAGGGPGPIGPGQSYQVQFTAEQGQRLIFATMLVQSNDLFYGTDDSGIALFEGSVPVTGNITSSLRLWDCGTEVNEEPGYGMNQAPRQSGPDTGTDENGTVQLINNVNDGYTWPGPSTQLEVTLQLVASS